MTREKVIQFILSNQKSGIIQREDIEGFSFDTLVLISTDIEIAEGVFKEKKAAAKK